MESETYLDLLDQEHGHEGDEGDANNHSDDSLCKCELRLKKIFVPINIILLVGFQDVLVQAVVRSYLEPQVYAEGYQQYDSRDT
jgi:hypothetical protein